MEMKSGFLAGGRVDAQLAKQALKTPAMGR
jgi:hypothetical protein